VGSTQWRPSDFSSLDPLKRLRRHPEAGRRSARRGRRAGGLDGAEHDPRSPKEAGRGRASLIDAFGTPSPQDPTRETSPCEPVQVPRRRRAQARSSRPDGAARRRAREAPGEDGERGDWTGSSTTPRSLEEAGRGRASPIDAPETRSIRHHHRERLLHVNRFSETGSVRDITANDTAV
jgi:hypothetical protein